MWTVRPRHWIDSLLMLPHPPRRLRRIQGDAIFSPSMATAGFRRRWFARNSQASGATPRRSSFWAGVETPTEKPDSVMTTATALLLSPRRPSLWPASARGSSPVISRILMQGRLRIRAFANRFTTVRARYRQRCSQGILPCLAAVTRAWRIPRRTLGISLDRRPAGPGLSADSFGKYPSVVVLAQPGAGCDRSCSFHN